MTDVDKKAAVQELIKTRRELAEKVMSVSAAALLLNMRYMAKPINNLIMQPSESDEKSFAVDGRVIRYDPAALLERYKQNERLPVHDLLHMLLHCLFRHWNVGAGIDRLRWNAACDIAVEAAVMRIASGFCANDKIAQKSSAILEISVRVKPLTAEKIYAYFANEEVSAEKLAEYCQVFRVDSHGGWFKDDTPDPDEEEPPHISPEIVEKDDERGEENPDGEDSEESGVDGEENEDVGENDSEESRSESSDDAEISDISLEQWLENANEEQRRELEEKWRALSKEVQTELESFGKNSAQDSAYLVDILERINRERYDYGEFLRRFAVSGEVMREDLDHFDVGFYSYGMSLYGNVALIEPPEYKETKLVREFVIAVDTSGSVRGKLVEQFLQKTYSILKSTESFFTKVNIFVIQCDTEVRDAARITCQRDLENYIDKLEIKGLGGTDFRPIFDYTDQLIKSGQLTNLRGLVCFTDGLGEFPEVRPQYEAAFAFVGEPEEGVCLPPWAVKILLEEEDIFDELQR